MKNLRTQLSAITLIALLVVAGSMVKQTVALAAAPIFLHLLLVGRRRDALLYLHVQPPTVVSQGKGGGPEPDEPTVYLFTR